MIIDTICSRCRREAQLEVSDAGYQAWVNGTLIQNALPELSEDDREILISGICGPCFDDMWDDKERE